MPPNNQDGGGGGGGIMMSDRKRKRGSSENTIEAKPSLEDLCTFSVTQSFCRCEGHDPLMLMLLVVCESNLRLETIAGDAVVECVRGALEGASRSPRMSGWVPTNTEIVEMIRGSMLADACPVKKGFPRTELGSVIHRVKTTGLKADAIEKFLKSCEGVGVNYSYPSIVQVLYEKPGRKIVRTHELYSHPSDLLMSCKERLFSPERGDEICIVEVPNRLQLLNKFYVDWDMLTNVFDSFGENESERLEYVRTVAMRTPEAVCKVFIKLGLISATETIQVVVVEGTRKSESKKCHKVSLHFVFQILMTRQQYRQVWIRLYEYIDGRVKGGFGAILNKRNGGVVDRDSLEAMGDDLFTFVGMDLAPSKNMEQGLAFPFSRKSMSDPISRPVAIIHICGGEEMLWEVPCRYVWRAGYDILGKHPPVADLNPSAVLCSFLYSSICIPGPRCIGLIPGSTPNTKADVPRDRKMLPSDPAQRIAMSIRNRMKFMGEANGSILVTGKMAIPSPFAAAGPGGRYSSTDRQPRRTMFQVEGGDINDMLPKWFLGPFLDNLGAGRVRHIVSFETLNMPAGAKKMGAFAFQVNQSPMSMCIRRMMKIPFDGYRAHSNNGAIYYVDGDDVYVSCMSTECGTLLKDKGKTSGSERERYACMALCLKKRILLGEANACEDLNEYTIETLTAEDKDFLKSVCIGDTRVQSDNGCHDHYHQHNACLLDEIVKIKEEDVTENKDEYPGFKAVPLCRRKKLRGRTGALHKNVCENEDDDGDNNETDQKIGKNMPCGCSLDGATAFISDFAKVPVSHMCASVGGNRTWIRVTKSLLSEYIRIIRG